MAIYRCAKCGKFVERDSNKGWIRSYCSMMGEITRLMRQGDTERVAYSIKRGLKDAIADTKKNWPRIRDLPVDEQDPFIVFLDGQTRPMIDGVPGTEQDAYYPSDYERWKSGLPIID